MITERYIFAAVVATMIGMVLKFDLHYHRLIIPFLIHAILITSVYFALLFNPKVHNALQSISRPYQIIAALMFVSLVGTQLAHKGHLTFPFVEWNMYGMAPADKDIDKIEGGFFTRTRYETVFREGRVEELDEHGIIPTFLGGRLRIPLGTAFWHYWNPADDAEKHRYQRKITDMLAGSGRIYNRVHPDDPIIAIRVSRFEDPLVKLDQRPPISYQYLFTVDIPSEPGR